MIGAEQLESRVQQESPEEIEDPIEPRDQRGARADHRAAQDQRAQDSPEQQAMLVAGIDAKILEDQQENENVVQAEGFFDDVAGKKLEAGPAAMRKENPRAKTKRKSDPCRALDRRFAQRNDVRAPVKQSQIEQQEQRDAGVEGDPERPGAHLGHALVWASHCGGNPQLLEFCAVVLGLTAFRLESSTLAVSPCRTVTGKSHCRRTSPEIASAPIIPIQ